MTEQSAPAIEATVVVPAHNAATTIGGQLDALAIQNFVGTWEVVVVDDASDDGTADIVALWADKLPSLTVVSLPVQVGESRARNTGARAGRGRLIAYCNADDLVSTQWLDGLVLALKENVLATGPIDLSKLNPPLTYSWRRTRGWQELPRWLGYLVPIMACTMGVRREAFELAGGFDETMTVGADFDFAWRVQLAGGTVGYAPDAVVHWRLRRGWSYFQRSIAYGAGDVELYRRFRHRGLRRRPARGVLRVAGVVLTSPLLLLPSYRYGWMHLAGVELGRLKGSIASRTLFL